MFILHAIHVYLFLLSSFSHQRPLHTFSLPGSAHGLDDLADNARVRQLSLRVSVLRHTSRAMEPQTYRRGVAQAVLLTAQDLAQDTTHDLAAPGLGEIIDDVDRLGRGERSDRPAHLHHEVLAHLLLRLVAALEGDERVDGLAGQLIRNTHDGSLSDQGCRAGQLCRKA